MLKINSILAVLTLLTVLGLPLSVQAQERSLLEQTGCPDPQLLATFGTAGCIDFIKEKERREQARLNPPKAEPQPAPAVVDDEPVISTAPPEAAPQPAPAGDGDLQAPSPGAKPGTTNPALWGTPVFMSKAAGITGKVTQWGSKTPTALDQKFLTSLGGGGSKGGGNSAGAAAGGAGGAICAGIIGKMGVNVPSKLQNKAGDEINKALGIAGDKLGINKAQAKFNEAKAKLDQKMAKLKEIKGKIAKAKKFMAKLGKLGKKLGIKIPGVG